MAGQIAITPTEPSTSSRQRPSAVMPDVVIGKCVQRTGKGDNGLNNLFIARVQHS